LCAQVCAFVFDAQVLMNRSFCLRQRDFKSAITCIYVAATLALGAMVKKQTGSLK
jgi:hypothetical protein